MYTEVIQEEVRNLFGTIDYKQITPKIVDEQKTQPKSPIKPQIPSLRKSSTTNKLRKVEVKVLRED